MALRETTAGEAQILDWVESNANRRDCANMFDGLAETISGWPRNDPESDDAELDRSQISPENVAAMTELLRAVANALRDKDLPGPPTLRVVD